MPSGVWAPIGDWSFVLQRKSKGTPPSSLEVSSVRSCVPNVLRVVSVRVQHVATLPAAEIQTATTH